MNFRKKPEVIEAVQWRGNFKEIKEFCSIISDLGCDCSTPEIKSWPLIIPTPEGELIANIGDWIIKDIRGEFWPCRPDIFDLTYEMEEGK